MQLLHITASASFPYNTRLASALCFKNFIKRNWTDEDGNYKLQQDEVTTIKQELISLMISVPPGIQTQLGEAVSVIADSDFWERWDTLVDVSCQKPDWAMEECAVLTRVDYHRISFPDCSQTTHRPTMVCCRLHTRSSSDGGPYSSRTNFIRRSTMCLRDSATRS